MPANRFVQIAYSNPKPGREDEYNEWYNDVHLPEVVGVPGYITGQRYELAGHQRPHLPAPRHRYMALYEIEGDLDALFAARDEAKRSGAAVEASNDCVNPDYLGYTGYLWVPMAPPLTHEDARRGQIRSS